MDRIDGGKATGGEPKENGRTRLVSVRDLTFSYPDSQGPTLEDINMDICTGEFIILAGSSGCGKSTLGRLINGIIPHLSPGNIDKGSVQVLEKSIPDWKIHDLATEVGMVFQNPDSQMCCLNVEQEIKFGPENVGLHPEDVVKRADQVIEWLGIDHLRQFLVNELSGGQKQRVAIGGSLSLFPKLLILDEPTTDLDPQGKSEVIRTLMDLWKKLDITIMVIERDLDDLVEVATRIVVMDKGRIVRDGNPEDVFMKGLTELRELGIKVPEHTEVAFLLRERGLGDGLSTIVHQADVRDIFLRDTARFVEEPETCLPAGAVAGGDCAVRFENVEFGYERHRKILKGISFDVHAGEFAAIIGPNGSGKTTVARLTVGLLRTNSGTILTGGKNPSRTDIGQITAYAGYLFQNPDSQLFCPTVKDEIEFGMRRKKYSDAVISERRDWIAELLSLTAYMNRHPLSLSRGERQRLAVATVLVSEPRLVVLDEPTTGQDVRNLMGLLTLIKRLVLDTGGAVLMICHDMDIVCTHATKTLVFLDGQIMAQGPTREVFATQEAILKKARIKPPFVTEVTRGRVKQGTLLSVQELSSWVSSKQGGA